jgi:hypothetical protein
MKDLLILLADLVTTLAKLLGPGGAKTVPADSHLMKQQLLIMNRGRRRAPNLLPLDRFLVGFWSLFLNPRHLRRVAVIIGPSTLLEFHNLLKQRDAIVERLIRAIRRESLDQTLFGNANDLVLKR